MLSNIQMTVNFYPRPPRGGRLLSLVLASASNGYFYPRPPRGGRPAGQARLQSAKRFLSTPSARRATVIVRIGCPREEISIHALREEGDAWSGCLVPVTLDFYPRPPRGGRPQQHGGRLPLVEFLSTPSARRATISACASGPTIANFYPRPPRGGRRCPASSSCRPTLFLSTPSARRATIVKAKMTLTMEISIHALREEGDHPTVGRRNQMRHFYPRPPRGGRLFRAHQCAEAHAISIHALREEGDAAGGCSECVQKNFYPRPPRGGRLVGFHQPFQAADFYPRPPRGGRRAGGGGGDHRDAISIHALREEGDSTPSAFPPGSFYFYPRPPRGGRPVNPSALVELVLISIHALREEGDSKNRDKISIFKQIIQHSARI